MESPVENTVEEEQEVATESWVTSKKRKLTDKQLEALAKGRETKRRKAEERRKKEETGVNLLCELDKVKKENEALKEQIIKKKLEDLEEENVRLKRATVEPKRVAAVKEAPKKEVEKEVVEPTIEKQPPSQKNSAVGPNPRPTIAFALV